MIPQGRSFFSRLLELSKTVPHLQDFITLNKGCKSDLKYLFLLCKNWNGISFLYNDFTETSVALKSFAPSIGFGGFYNNQCFASTWPKEIPSLPKNMESSAHLELYAIVVAHISIGNCRARKQTVVLCDNEATVNILNNGRSSISAINRLIRRLTWTCATGNLILRAPHIPVLDNKISDALSRFKFQEFRQPCPNVSPCSMQCPTQILDFCF